MSTPYIMVLGIGVGSLILAWLCGYWKKNSRKASQRRTFCLRSGQIASSSVIVPTCRVAARALSTTPSKNSGCCM